MPDLNPPDCGLERWLRIATYDLCEDAKASVRAEIAAHYEDALAAAVESGNSRAAAEGLALKELGNPFDAQARMNRVYLTKGEAQFMEKYQRVQSHRFKRAHWARLALAAGLQVAILLVGGAAWLRVSLLALWIVSVLPLLELMTSWAVRRTPGLTLRRYLMISLLSKTVLTSVCIANAHAIMGRPMWSVVISGLIWLCIPFLFDLRLVHSLIRKLGHNPRIPVNEGDPSHV